MRHSTLRGRCRTLRGRSSTLGGGGSDPRGSRVEDRPRRVEDRPRRVKLGRARPSAPDARLPPRWPPFPQCPGICSRRSRPARPCASNRPDQIPGHWGNGGHLALKAPNRPRRSDLRGENAHPPPPRVRPSGAGGWTLIGRRRPRRVEGAEEVSRAGERVSNEPRARCCIS